MAWIEEFEVRIPSSTTEGQKIQERIISRLEQIGFPFPSIPILLAAGALAGTHHMNLFAALATAGLDVRSIRDTTAIPHNGCRPPKKRRV